MTKYVWVTLQKEFVHTYKNAPDEVSYLRYPHRHIAHIKVAVQVFDNDREIEFIMLKHYLEKVLDIQNSENNSCESIACNIVSIIKEKYCVQLNREIIVEVSEDGENGCKIVNAQY